jgi:hypothetical protein
LVAKAFFSKGRMLLMNHGIDSYMYTSSHVSEGYRKFIPETSRDMLSKG